MATEQRTTMMTHHISKSNAFPTDEKSARTNLKRIEEACIHHNPVVIPTRREGVMQMDRGQREDQGCCSCPPIFETTNLEVESMRLKATSSVTKLRPRSLTSSTVSTATTAGSSYGTTVSSSSSSSTSSPLSSSSSITIVTPSPFGWDRKVFDNTGGSDFNDDSDVRTSLFRSSVGEAPSPERRRKMLKSMSTPTFSSFYMQSHTEEEEEDQEEEEERHRHQSLTSPPESRLDHLDGSVMSGEDTLTQELDHGEGQEQDQDHLQSMFKVETASLSPPPPPPPSESFDSSSSCTLSTATYNLVYMASQQEQQEELFFFNSGSNIDQEGDNGNHTTTANRSKDSLISVLDPSRKNTIHWSPESGPIDIFSAMKMISSFEEKDDASVDLEMGHQQESDNDECCEGNGIHNEGEYWMKHTERCMRSNPLDEFGGLNRSDCANEELNQQQQILEGRQGETSNHNLSPRLIHDRSKLIRTLNNYQRRVPLQSEESQDDVEELPGQDGTSNSWTGEDRDMSLSPPSPHGGIQRRRATVGNGVGSVPPPSPLSQASYERSSSNTNLSNNDNQQGLQRRNEENYFLSLLPHRIQRRLRTSHSNSPTSTPRMRNRNRSSSNSNNSNNRPRNSFLSSAMSHLIQPRDETVRIPAFVLVPPPPPFTNRNRTRTGLQPRRLTTQSPSSYIPSPLLAPSTNSSTLPAGNSPTVSSNRHPRHFPPPSPLPILTTITTILPTPMLPFQRATKLARLAIGTLILIASSAAALSGWYLTYINNSNYHPYYYKGMVVGDSSTSNKRHFWQNDDEWMLTIPMANTQNAQIKEEVVGSIDVVMKPKHLSSPPCQRRRRTIRGKHVSRLTVKNHDTRIDDLQIQSTFSEKMFSCHSDEIVFELDKGDTIDTITECHHDYVDMLSSDDSGVLVMDGNTFLEQSCEEIISEGVGIWNKYKEDGAALITIQLQRKNNDHLRKYKQTLRRRRKNR